MINLLPPEGHRAVKQEYFFRAGASVLLLFSCVGIFLTVAFIPTYVLVGAQIKAFEGTEKSNPDTSVVTEVDMKETEDLLKQLKKTSEQQTTNSLIKKIEETASSEIMFKTFRIDMNKGTTTIQVQGIAETREALAQFKNALVATDVFEKADVPISDLARETDLPFMITIVPKSKN
jgi:hypothetical protein